MKVGLYFGSFNPIHIGHLVIANYMANNSDLDQVWLVVSPQNPLKEKKSLLADYHRLNLVKIALEDNDKLRASDIEFKLDQPSYTVNTLAHLKEKYPENDFSLIMGEDNLRTFHKWKNHDQILKNHTVFVYPRVLTVQELKKLNAGEGVPSPSPSTDAWASKTNDFSSLQRGKSNTEKGITILEDTPIMKISSSMIRKTIKAGGDIKYLVTDPVLKYIEEMNFYK